MIAEDNVPFIHCYTSQGFRDTVVSCAVPVGNVSWMLFQEGRSSNFRLRKGVEQAHIKCTVAYFA